MDARRLLRICADAAAAARDLPATGPVARLARAEAVAANLVAAESDRAARAVPSRAADYNRLLGSCALAANAAVARISDPGREEAADETAARARTLENLASMAASLLRRDESATAARPSPDVN